MISLHETVPLLSKGSGVEINKTHFFEPSEPVKKYRNKFLPHWEQDFKLQFITLRMNDSLPQSKLMELKELSAKLPNFNLLSPEDVERILLKIEYWLDKGFGECWLKYKEVQDIIDEAIKFYDGRQWDLFEYVIMPNHIHLLAVPYISLKKIMGDFRRYTTKKINNLIRKNGEFWQVDYFDRIIRSFNDYEEKRDYIKTNPINWGIHE